MNKWLILLLIFVLSVILRLWTLNQMGRTWDEGAYIIDGYKLIELAKKGDFYNNKWYNNPDHPPLARYLYGLASHLDAEKVDSKGEPIFKYDWTFARLVSVLFSSLTVLIVGLMGWRYFSFFVGATSSLILAMLPVFLGYSQIATLESLIVFFFTISVFLFIEFIKKDNLIKLILTGVLTGLALGVKQSNILLFPLFLLIYILWYVVVGKKGKRNIFSKKLLKVFGIFFVAIITFILIWPMPWFHLKEVIEFHNNMWISNVKLPPPEVFFGKLVLVPKIYYLVYFVITTPAIIVALFLIGLKFIDKKKNWILYTLILWFFFPFIHSLYNFRQHGIRYIIEIYAPLSFIAAIGLDYVSSKLPRKFLAKVICFSLVVIYLFNIAYKLKPYYLDYFNELIGGTNGVYKSNLFQLGWWGQGIGEAGLFIKNNAPDGSKIGLAISPNHVMPPLKNMNISQYLDNMNYDYIIVNYFHVLREGFNDKEIKLKYKPIFYARADQAILVTVYKK